MTNRRIFLGTTNPGKVREFATILAPLGIEIKTVSLDVPEEAMTFEENAVEKARAYAKHVGENQITISEDSGLVIPNLKGWPGPFSARFADVLLSNELDFEGHQPSGKEREEIDVLNNQRVLELMEGIKQPHRGASFVVCLVVMRGDTVLFQARGESHGWISEEARGDNGFGYDPIFVGSDTYGKTYAELGTVRKNLRSHRKQVLKEFRTWISQKLKDGDLFDA